MGEQGFTLMSPAFKAETRIPAEYTCDGQNKPPKLEWTQPPRETRSFLLIVDDPDAPNGTFTHWILFNIEATAAVISQDAVPGTAGKNDFGDSGYGGPCPPPGHGEHRYFFRLHALDVESLNLQTGASRKDVEQAVEGHIVDTAELMGRYERQKG